MIVALVTFLSALMPAVKEVAEMYVDRLLCALSSVFSLAANASLMLESPMKRMLAMLNWRVGGCCTATKGVEAQNAER